MIPKIIPRVLPLVGILLMALSVYALNRWSIPYSDDIAYSLEGENTPMEGVAHHAENFSDLVRIQVNDYVKGPNGRVFVHAVVTTFCMLGLHDLFDVLNTGMWFLLVWLLMREAGIRGRFLTGAALVFVFLWRAETCCMSAAFAVNYLWVACFTVVMMRLWRGTETCGLIPVSFLYGWSQEAFSLPMIAGLGFCCAIRSLGSGRFAWTVRRSVAYVAMVLGTAGCVGGHLLSGRELAAVSCSRIALLVLPIWPAVLLACVAYLLWRNRRRLGALVADDLEWWMYLLAAGSLFALIGLQGLRLALPMLLAALVVCLRNRRFFARLRWTFPPLVAFSIVWLLAGAGVQHCQAEAYREMVRVYLKDRQGLTYRRPVTVGPLDGTVSDMQESSWSRGLLRHRCGHAKQPIVLSPSLYAEVMEGASSNRVYSVRVPGSSGWRRILPGRLRRMFPDDDFHAGLPSERIVITDPSGHEVTLLDEDAR